VALLLRHVPDRYEHLVRYVGYSNRVRGERAKVPKDRDPPRLPAPAPEPLTELRGFAGGIEG